ncbi:VolA/Pla-1 family phospholipase [Photobacterium carnosum]|uniref:VolA/Pla-1 family phospholipase n=1 Tax=Photobacterium carnosum TaxID=2023717 RepID=UPI001E48C094|nr:VolA/Pla-1 family phospholipase [Photobacterium carnosum]MCD9514462.1 lipase [Photobacterium carnosum]
MKIRSIALLVTSALSLMGCKSDSTLENQSPIDPNIAASLNAETKINFDLLSANKTLILPTYLAMDAQDGTLATEVKAQDKTNTSDPLVAMGQTDGWSTTQPITINFIGKALDPTPAATSFYLIKGTPTDPNNVTQLTQSTDGKHGDFKLNVLGNSLIVTLLKPLDPTSNYMYAVTDDLKDVNGQAVGMSNSYALLKSNNLPPAPALLPEQKITHATEEAFHGIVQKRDIIFSSWFTTLSSGDVLFAAKMATEEAINAGAHNVWQGSAIASSVTPKDLDKLFTFSQPVEVNDPNKVNGKSKVTIYQGKLSIPYYLDIRANKFMNTPWQSGMPSLAKIKYVLSNGSNADKATILAQLANAKVTLADMAQVATNPQVQIKVLQNLMGTKLTLANGNQLDPERLITRYSAVPELKSVQTIDYTLVLPNNKKCQTLGANDVTIFQHGITADKSVLTTHSDGLLSLAEKLVGNQCRAIFAINLPLHGDRSIKDTNKNVLKDDDGNIIGSASGKNGNPAAYLNLTNLTVARDNLRQSTIDVVNLRASIGKLFTDINKKKQSNRTSFKPVPPLDRLNPNNGVSFSGHSLGAIVGTNVGNIANRPTLDPTFDKQYFAINKLALANPGAEIPYLLLNSPSFSDLIKGGIVKGINPEFAKSCGTKNVALCYQALVSQLTAANNAGNSLAKITLDTMDDSFNKFAYAAQTVMDPVDPINLADGIPSSVPVYVQMVKGDSTIPNITTPNNLPYSPFTGTEPLIKQLGLALNNATKGWKEYTPGSHTSLLDITMPTNDSFTIEASKATTLEMQTDMADFLNK